MHRLHLAQLKNHSGTARPGHVDSVQWHSAQVFAQVSAELFTNRTGTSLEKGKNNKVSHFSEHKLHSKWSPPLGFSIGTQSQVLMPPGINVGWPLLHGSAPCQDEAFGCRLFMCSLTGGNRDTQAHSKHKPSLKHMQIFIHLSFKLLPPTTTM